MALPPFSPTENFQQVVLHFRLETHVSALVETLSSVAAAVGRGGGGSTWSMVPFVLVSLGGYQRPSPYPRALLWTRGSFWTRVSSSGVRGRFSDGWSPLLGQVESCSALEDELTIGVCNPRKKPFVSQVIDSQLREKVHQSVNHMSGI